MSKDYNRNRPFMVIKTSFSPAKGSPTHIKDWAKDKKGQWNSYETVLFVDRLSKKHLNESSTIIDLTKNSVVMTRYIDPTHEELVEFYVGKYADKVQEAMRVWVLKQASENKMNPVELATELQQIVGSKTKMTVVDKTVTDAVVVENNDSAIIEEIKNSPERAKFDIDILDAKDENDAIIEEIKNSPERAKFDI